MKVLYGYRGLEKELKDPVAAIGIFDGIHLGHKRVIKNVLNPRYRERDKVVITFDPHPQTVLCPKKVPPRIMSLEHRLFIFERMGLDAVIIIKFSEFLAKMDPEEFIRKVLCGIGATTVYVGSNFHFGSGKKGDIETFKKIGKAYGVEVKAQQPVKRKGRVISSTWLRKLIANGKIEEAERLLRRPVSVLGTVVTGDKRGGVLGVPTANIDPHHEVTPPPGVYAVVVDVDGKLFSGVLNIGFNPTFYKKKRSEPQIEVHIVGFKGDLYGRFLEIFFIKKLRREKRFKTEKQFKRQITRDVDCARKVLSNKRIQWKIKKYKHMPLDISQ